MRVPGSGSPLARAGLAYAGVRLLAFLACLGVGALAGLHGLELLLAAFLVSAVVSYPLARRQRSALAQRIADRRPR